MVEEYVSKTSKSRALRKRAEKVLPGGVSYGIRYFEPYPFYTARAKRSKLYDVDGNEYVDFWLGHTALILGHSPLKVMDAVKVQLENGTMYGTSNELEIKLAEQVEKMVPSAEMTRFTNSGTESNMYVTRLARAYTGRKKIAKFEGGWHGGYDALHKGVKYPFDVSESAGLVEAALQDTVVLPFNDLERVRQKLKNDDLASIIVEPVLGAGGGIPADRDFLKGLRELCDEKDVLLVFDEVITGFRLAPGGGQQYYGVTPDLTVFGKILGGGFPIGAFCGRREIMERVNAQKYQRPNYSFHGGTFAANPISVTAGLETLKILEDGLLISKLNNVGNELRRKLGTIFEARGVDCCVTGAGSLFNVHFTKKKVKNAQEAFESDRNRLLSYNLALISKGVFLLPTHNGALCTVHSSADIEQLYSETEQYAETIEHSV